MNTERFKTLVEALEALPDHENGLYLPNDISREYIMWPFLLPQISGFWWAQSGKEQSRNSSNVSIHQQSNMNIRNFKKLVEIFEDLNDDIKGSHGSVLLEADGSRGGLIDLRL
jgi:hypothetical protein